MRSCLLGVSAMSVALTMSTAPVRADDEAAAIAGAIAIIGLAALAHNKNHYQEGYRPNGENETAAFERGYRDGLHNEPYDSRHSSTAYGQGFDAGQKERSNRLAHKQRDIAGVKVPAAAAQSCVNEASSSWGVGRHDVHIVNAGQEGADNFYIELASGHRHVICGSNSQGQVFNFRNGRM